MRRAGPLRTGSEPSPQEKKRVSSEVRRVEEEGEGGPGGLDVGAGGWGGGSALPARVVSCNGG